MNKSGNFDVKMYENIKNEEFNNKHNDSILSSGNSELEVEKVLNELQSYKKLRRMVLKHKLMEYLVIYLGKIQKQINILMIKTSIVIEIK
jgi:hypothetical protein